MQRGQLWNVPFARLVAATVKQPPTKELCRKQNKTYFLLKETNPKRVFLFLFGKNVSFFIQNRTNFLLKGTNTFQSLYILEKLQPAKKKPSNALIWS